MLHLLAFLALFSAAFAEGRLASQIAQGRPRGAYTPTVVSPSGTTPPAGLRVARAGSVNFIVMVGNAADGDNEQRYAKAQAAVIGGFFFHGAFSPDDVVSWLVGCGQKGTPVDSIVFIGHMSELTYDPLADQLKARDAAWAPVVQKRNGAGQLENRVGFVHPGFSGTAGVPGIPNMTNWNRDAFVGKIETGLAKANLRPDQVFTDRCRIVFRVCETGVFSRKLLDELATLVPVGGEVVGYDVPYVWNFTQYPLGFTTYQPDGEQARGRITIPGSYRTPAAPAPAPQADAGAGPGAGPGGGPGAGLASADGPGAPGDGAPTGLLGVAMAPPAAPAAPPIVTAALPAGVDEATLVSGVEATHVITPQEPQPEPLVAEDGDDTLATPIGALGELPATTRTEDTSRN